MDNDVRLIGGNPGTDGMFSTVASDEYLNPYATTPLGSLLTPMVTLYTYDTLDNLTCVEQHGTATGQTGCSSAPSNDSSSAWRIRRFPYDSLGLSFAKM